MFFKGRKLLDSSFIFVNLFYLATFATAGLEQVNQSIISGMSILGTDLVIALTQYQEVIVSVLLLFWLFCFLNIFVYFFAITRHMKTIGRNKLLWLAVSILFGIVGIWISYLVSYFAKYKEPKSMELTGNDKFPSQTM
ncbi:hypothetical protein [Reinekea thalattae]|uniref:Uncharacterized protein n=1 Tax=Reinekea thalattae TaxID=2593301 RepID=A0A5C8ZCB1_9GAMM|nr:hypothetical protein [Reinekea thalattae]TXR54480.1 hypothetical protein FME95_08080 [Reinekea thalattae]